MDSRKPSITTICVSGLGNPERTSNSRMRVSRSDSAPPSIIFSAWRSCTRPPTPAWRRTKASTSAAFNLVALASASKRITAVVGPFRRPRSRLCAPVWLSVSPARRKSHSARSAAPTLSELENGIAACAGATDAQGAQPAMAPAAPSRKTLKINNFDGKEQELGHSPKRCRSLTSRAVQHGKPKRQNVIGPQPKRHR